MLIVIDKGGNVAAGDATSKAELTGATGKYVAHRAGSLLIMTLDEGTGAVARAGEALAMAGNVEAQGLLALMNLFGQNRETGRLVLKRQQVERVVLMHNGDVASIGSNLPSDRLGVFLVRMGKVTERDLEAAQRESEKTGKRIGQMLLMKGLIDAHELWSAIQEQITELFADVMQWVDGSFVLYRLAPGFAFPTTPPLPMQGLLLEAVRRADEMSVYRVRIPSVHARLKRTAKPAGDVLEDPELGLANAAYQILIKECSLADVSKALHVAEFDATRACYELLKRGLVEIVKAQPNTPAAKLKKDEQARIEVFNLAFREIHDEVVRSGQLERFVVGVRKFLSDEGHAFHVFFHGVVPDATGALPVDTLARNLGRLVAEGHDASEVIGEALNELTFFMLFQCGEVLDSQSDEHLGRRVRLIHASLR
ncbi:MAG: DUF4388 domain-containing protein [Deltaproteobacteria bacterium]|nr:DUF4388 domain-containing protein [Deltaproteobacteria bacterium]